MHAYQLIFEYIETFYNTVRIHSHCGYWSPNQYEKQYLQGIEENASKITSYPLLLNVKMVTFNLCFFLT